MSFRSFWHCLAVLCLLCTILPSQASAQGQIRGAVTSAQTGAPLANVQVYLTNLKRGTVTDENGRYALQGLKAGTYRLQFSLLGYEKATRRVQLQAGETATIDVALSPTTLRTGEVVVLADNPRRNVDVPQPTASLNQTERLETGAPSLWDALDRLPGVARSTNGPGIERPYLRGLSGGRILVMMQDVPYSYQTWDPELGLTMTGNGTEQVDVIQGPATLQYGPGAMGGVIDLVEEHPAPVGQTKGSYTLQAYSNTRGLYNELALKQTRSGWFWGARASFDTHADYRPGEGETEGGEGEEAEGDEEEGEETVPNSRYNHLQLKAFTGLSRDWGSTRLTYQYLRHKNGIIEVGEEEEEEEEIEGEEEGREIGPPYHAVADHILTSDTQVRLGRGWLRGVLGLQRNDQQEFEPAPGEPGGKEAGIDLALTTGHYRLNYELPLSGNWQLTSGLQGYVQHNESKGREPFVANADENRVGLFSLLSWSSDRLTFEGGLRYDWNALETESVEGEEEEEASSEESAGVEAELDRSFGLFSGSAGLTYQLRPDWRLKLNLGTGNRPPSLAALTANGLLREVRRYLVGNPDLNAEYNTEVDLTSSWHRPGLTISVGAFYNRMYNYTYQVPTGETVGEGEETFPVYEYRQNDADFWGGHAEVDVHPTSLDWFRLYGQFDLILAQLRGSDTWLPLIPAHQLRSGVELIGTEIGPFRQLRGRVEFDTHFAQDRVPAWGTATDGYVLTDVSLNGRLPWAGRSVLLGLHARNLLNKRYTSALSLLKRDGVPNMGRTITLSARVPFGW